MIFVPHEKPVRLTFLSRNKALWEHGHSPSFVFVWGWFLLLWQNCGCDTDHLAHRARNIYCLALYRKGHLTSY